MSKPLAIDLFSGLGGWAEGLIAEGFRVVGFDIKDIYRETGTPRKPNVELVLQDVLTIHGSQFKGASLIVCSPPCQNYSYLAMPWSRSKSPHSQKAKALRRKWETEGPDNRLFDACFRIQREAIEATRKECHECFGAGGWAETPSHFTCASRFVKCPLCQGEGTVTRFIPLIVENVRGANEWVSPKSRYNYGSFHLWGDVPAIMPIQAKRGQGGKNNGGSWFNIGSPGQKVTNQNPVHELAAEGVKVASADGGRRTDVGKGARFTSRDCGVEGTKIGGDWSSDPKSTCRKHGSKSNARKAASAQIAKIPLPLSEHIARIFRPVHNG